MNIIVIVILVNNYYVHSSKFPVRQKVKDVINLLEDKERLHSERTAAQKNKDKFVGISRELSENYGEVSIVIVIIILIFNNVSYFDFAL